MKIKLVDVELSQPIAPVTGLEGYYEVWFLTRLHGLPVGTAKMTVVAQYILPEEVLEIILLWLQLPIMHHLLEDGLLNQNFFKSETGLNNQKYGLETYHLQNLISNFTNPRLSLEENCQTDPPCLKLRKDKATWFVTIGICTRDGASRLGRCLDALDQLDYPNFEVLVVDNASKDDSTKTLMEKQWKPNYRYVYEPRPGLSWARNRVIQEARGDIIALTDDDARPDPLWLLSLVNALQQPGISLVTGPGYPLELENDIQIYCENYWGHNGGFERKNRGLAISGFPKHPYNTNTFGGSFNLVAWKEVFQKVGGFDPALGRGSPAGSATDTDLIYRLLRMGYTISYEPTALVKLEHPSEFRYIERHGYLGTSGIFAFYTKCFLKEPPYRWQVSKTTIKFFWRLSVDFLLSLPGRDKEYRKLRFANVRGALIGPINYYRSIKKVKEVTLKYQNVEYRPKLTDI
jgi:glycosyltransferase involved in cell wall biosynthesis